MKDLDIIEFGTMVEHSGLDITCPKYCTGPASSYPPKKGQKVFTKLKTCLTEDYPQKNSEILSGQYGVNLLLVGASLMLAFSHHDAYVQEEHLLAFITTLMIVQLFWMLWYVIRRGRQRHTRQKDVHAGTSWIRGGITLLAVISLIMDAFRIGYYVGYENCVSISLAVYPAVHVLHTFSQVHFLWFHIKDVINTYETFERFGVIHAVFTNLLLWCNGVMAESDHFLNNHKKRLTAVGYLNLSIADIEPHCNCTTSVCAIFSKSLYYLYPFNIEYHILVSAMLFVMWKNIGRSIDYHFSSKPTHTKMKGVVVGPILGFIALASSIGVLVVYIILVEGSDEIRESGVSMFYCYGIVMLVFMCVAGVGGLLLYRADRRPPDTSKNPSRQLDTELLFGSSVGAWLTSWCSVVAILSASSNYSYRWTNFVYSLLMVLEKYVQNLFIIESLYRKQDTSDKKEKDSPATPEVFSVSSCTSLDTPYNGIINQAFEDQEVGCISQDARHEENGQVVICSQKHSEGPLPSLKPPPRDLENPKTESQSRKQRVLKNISIFLLMCNISLWILPAFGCRPQYDNLLEQEVYGFTTWSNVLNFAMPITLFYRMHSVASLFEVFQRV